MIESILVIGEALEPGVIFKGKELQTQWLLDKFKRQLPVWRFLTSPNGWTSNEIGLAYLNGVFLSQIKMIWKRFY